MNSFNKEERLCSRKSIDLLFKNGSSFLLYPFRVSYLLTDISSKFPAQIVINVSKKRYKRAVDRNLVKRRTREAYRLQKGLQLYNSIHHLDQCLLLSVQFVGKKIYDYSFFEKKLSGVLKKLTLLLVPEEDSLLHKNAISKENMPDELKDKEENGNI